ncbi:conjugal transfer protein TraF [Oceanospirillum sanctuarii]|uniref:conjugal transfer protein TraF n=1 Tax=Oceanospirillum sanctuarii TaxID=1434821 RepID=UPI001594B499|nr:conjugal transfer protein TraF [Oceanospirillum sanctuarii]
MKKQLLALAVASVVTAPAFAAMPVGTYGAATTLGQTASPVTINSVRFNPAAGYLVVDHEDGEKVRLGYWSQFGGSIEFGEANNFQDKIEDLQDRLDELNTKEENNTLTPSDITAVQNDFNDLLLDFGESGSMKLSGAVSVPGMPLAIYIKPLEGVVTLDAAFSSIAGISFLDSPVENDLSTASALYIKGANILQFGAGFSRSVFELKGRSPLNGELVLGIRGNLYSASLTKQVSLVDRTGIDDKSVGDLISDGLDANSKDTTALGVDIGAVWQSDYYQIGVTGKNLNSPEFEYGSLSGNNEATEFSDEIDLDETHIMDPQFTVDGAFFTKTKALMVSGSFDLTEVNDMVGDQQQNLHISATYFPQNPFVPVARFGYQKNLAGSELSALNFGLGLFRGVANLDFTYGLESVQVDGSSMPRQLGMHFSFEESF